MPEPTDEKLMEMAREVLPYPDGVKLTPGNVTATTVIIAAKLRSVREQTAQAILKCVTESAERLVPTPPERVSTADELHIALVTAGAKKQLVKLADWIASEFGLEGTTQPAQAASGDAEVQR